MLEGGGDSAKPREERRFGVIPQQGGVLREQWDHVGRSLEGKNVLRGKLMSSG